MKNNNKEFMENYRKIRKPMPPSEKVIKPKMEFKRERWDWREALEDDGDYGREDYKGISQVNKE